jgi:hypothetical protein
MMKIFLLLVLASSAFSNGVEKKAPSLQSEQRLLSRGSCLRLHSQLHLQRFRRKGEGDRGFCE